MTNKKPAEASSLDLEQSSASEFLQWIDDCSVTYDYRNPSKDKPGKERRLKSLKSLCQFVEVPDNVTTYFMPFLDLVMEMLQQSLLRVLPPDGQVVEQMPVEDTGKLDFSWQDDPTFPYIEDCYRLFTSLVRSPATEIKAIKQFITPPLVRGLLNLFASREVQEHECLSQLIHSLYLVLVPRRKMMRSAIRECLIVMAQDDQLMNGTTALLNFTASYISGFMQPLRPEHVKFFDETFVPLHNLTENATIHSALLRCSMLFLTKNPGLALPLLQGLLRHWPIVNAGKQVLFLQEIEEILDTCGVGVIAPLAGKLFQRLAWCLTQRHYRLVDVAVTLLTQNESMAMVVKTHKEVAFPVLVPAVIAQQSNSELVPVTRSAFWEAGERLRQWDPEMYAMALTIEPMKVQNSRERWETLEALVAQIDKHSQT